MAHLRGFCIVIAALASSSLSAATLTVDQNGGADYTDIQSAIDAAADGDTVLVKPGEYVITEPITFKGKAITVKSESGPEATTIRMSETPADQERASVALFENQETATSVLQGFTLTGGKGTKGVAVANVGGGLYCRNSRPTIVQCIVAGNRADSGGGLFSYSSLTITECIFEGNWADQIGGGLVLYGDRLSSTITRCTISGNHAGFKGGGLIVFMTSSTISSCTISANDVESSDDDGGAVTMFGAAKGSFINCLVFANSGKVSMSFDRQSSASLLNCTIAGNEGLILGNTASFKNCIVWGNGSNSIPGTATKCLTTTDPLFQAEGRFDFTRFKSVPIGGQEVSFPDFVIEEPDYHLQAGSSAIDAGTSEGAPAVDIEGIARPQGVGFDIGTYEFFQCPTTGDTHCLGVQVAGPDGGVPGPYTATAMANDDSSDPVIYTFTAKRGDEAPIVVGPQAGYTATFDLTVGTWTISVDVDDDTSCPDLAVDARCSTTVTVVPPGGLRIPGDANGDGGLDISDAVATLGFLFLGSPAKLPCGDGSATDPANLKLVDWQADRSIDISDAVATLSFLFLGGKPHTLAPEADQNHCVRIAGCSDRCGG